MRPERAKVGHVHESYMMSLEWHHSQSLKKKKFKTISLLSFGIEMMSFHVDVMPKGEVINSDKYINILKTLRKCLQ